jgi:small subunit ribosomal protein S20
MPILKNAIKKMRQDKKRTDENKARRSSMRTALKNALTLKTPESMSSAFSALDKAAKTHLIHKSKASRLKSRLTKAIAKAITSVTAPAKAKKASAKKTTVKKTTKKAQ